DAAGNTSAASSALAVTVDTTADAAPAGLDLAAGDDTGSSDSDNLTKATTGLSVSGTGVNGSVATLFDDKDNDGVVDAGESLGTSTVASGVWSVDASLAAGAHSLKAVQTDAAGNTSAASSALAVTVDTTAPTFTSLTTVTAVDENSGSVKEIYIAATNDNQSVTFSLKAVGDYAGLSINSSSGVVTLTADPDFEAKGSYAFTVVATDAAGNAMEQALNLAINDVNEAPVISVNKSVNFIQGETVTISSAKLFASDQDAGDTAAILTYTVTTAPTAGKLFRDANKDGVLDNGEALVVNSAFTQADINSGLLKYTGDAGTFDFSVSDDDESASLTDSATFILSPFAVTPKTLDQLDVGVKGALALPGKSMVTVITDNSLSKVDQLDAFVATLAPASDIQSHLDAFVENNAELDTVLAVTLSVDDVTEGSISISGTGAAIEGLVIDTNSLPVGTTLIFNNVEFAVIVGPATLSGGDGSNVVVGDDSKQHMILGADDDTLYGGGGDDTIGSLGGDDILYGEAGNDTITGGEGNDTLIGGEGDDSLDGEAGVDTARFSGNWEDYSFTNPDNGNSLVDMANHQTALPTRITITDKRDGSPDGVDTVTNIELFEFADEVLDFAAPTLESVTPAEGAVSVDVAGNLVFDFSETVVKSRGAIELQKDGVSIASTSDDTLEVAINGDKLTLNPTSDLEVGTTYTVRFDADSILDQAGNAYLDDEDEPYSFTTEAAYVGTGGNSDGGGIDAGAVIVGSAALGLLVWAIL
ncbi:MAG: Ig-like domain-containing protein, partial [Chlorobium phaeovibrioides]|nr:Ig-like domain-containing protein [Chlorobium phaeovibrioides]